MLFSWFERWRKLRLVRRLEKTYADLERELEALKYTQKRSSLGRARILQERVNRLSNALCVESEDLLADAGFPSSKETPIELLAIEVPTEN